MLIYSLKPGHDGTVALVDTESQKLHWSYEAEKDSFPRYEGFNPHQLIYSANKMPDSPDVIALSGWGKNHIDESAPIGAGYYGVTDEQNEEGETRFFGKQIKYFTSSHERSHIWCAYGLSPFPQGKPVYVLVWEGALGDFYLVNENLEIEHIGTVTRTPGNKYAFLYALADPTFNLPRGKLRFEDPGKLMALCAYGQSGEMTDREKETADFLIERDSILLSLAKDDMKWSPYYNIGLEHPEFTQLAKRFSDAIFDKFHSFAKENLAEGYPLLVVGGCGLNCDWNTAWKNTGLFEDVFIPPCTNDTGSAIGTAIDAMREFTGKAKVDWSVYCGQEFVDDKPDMPNVTQYPLDLNAVAEFLKEGKVVAWTQGNCEIGPRALGNRSILASAVAPNMKERLNEIKKREGFRPIAPICLEEDVSIHFDWQGPSPYMLHFQQVIDKELTAITHVDGTARVQTVTKERNAGVYDLLNAFKEISGKGVLCNTSLNFNGTGFINRTSDLYKYCMATGIEGFVYNDQFCVIER